MGGEDGEDGDGDQLYLITIAGLKNRAAIEAMLKAVSDHGFTALPPTASSVGAVSIVVQNNQTNNYFGEVKVTKIKQGDGAQAGNIITGDNSSANQSPTTNSTVSTGPKTLGQKEWKADIVAILHAMTDKLDELGIQYNELAGMVVALQKVDVTSDDVVAVLSEKLKAHDKGVLSKLAEFLRSLTGAAAEGATKVLIEKALGEALR